MKNFLARILEGINNFASRLQLRLQKTANALKITMLPILRWGWQWIWRLVGYFGRQFVGVIRWGWPHVRTRGPIIVWALSCLVLATVVVRLIFPLLGNAGWGKIGWVILACVLVAFLIWLLWSPVRRGYAGTVARSNWFWWPVAIFFLVVVGIGIYRYFPRPAGQVPIGLASPDVASTTFKVVVQTGKPAGISVPPGYRWDLVGSIPRGWTTDSGHRDTRGNRIQVFEVVPPTTEVTLEIKISKCGTPCVW